MTAFYVVADRGSLESDAPYPASLEHLEPRVGEHSGGVLQVRANGLPDAAKQSIIARDRDALGHGVEHAFLNGGAREFQAGAGALELGLDGTLLNTAVARREAFLAGWCGPRKFYAESTSPMLGRTSVAS